MTNISKKIVLEYEDFISKYNTTHMYMMSNTFKSILVLLEILISYNIEINTQSRPKMHKFCLQKTRSR